MIRSADRWAGGAVVALALAAVVLAVPYRVTFLADPIGPRAIPWLAAALLGLGGIGLIARPDPGIAVPTAIALRRAALITGGFLLYAAVLPLVGFILATIALGTGLAVAFGARPRAAVASAVLASLALYLLFAVVLGVPLPLGTLWPGIGG